MFKYTFRQLIRVFIQWIFINVLRARWIVGTGEECNRELGLRIMGVCMFYYKYPTPLICVYNPPEYRIAEFREFGETIKSKK